MGLIFWFPEEDRKKLTKAQIVRPHICWMNGCCEEAAVEEPVVIRFGDIYEDCSYHPVRCTEVKGDEVCGISLIDGSEPRSCSLMHCGVVKLTEEEATERVIIFHKDGERGLMRNNGWAEEDIDKFMKEWR